MEVNDIVLLKTMGKARIVRKKNSSIEVYFIDGFYKGTFFKTFTSRVIPIEYNTDTSTHYPTNEDNDIVRPHINKKYEK